VVTQQITSAEENLSARLPVACAAFLRKSRPESGKAIPPTIDYFEPGCQFRLPDTYPLPLCPWHAAPGKGIVKVLSAGGILVAGVGGKVAFDKIRNAIKNRKIRRQREAWRNKSGQQTTPFGGSSDGQKTAPPPPKFRLGRTVITSNALTKLSQADVHGALGRHHFGDWGDLDADDREANERALHDGGRLLSAYRSDRGEKFWVITEADRSATTVLMPEDY